LKKIFNKPKEKLQMEELHPSFSEQILAKEALKFHKIQLRLEYETDKNKRLILSTKLQEKRNTLKQMKKMIEQDVINF
jgi:hypothetical protein